MNIKNKVDELNTMILEGRVMEAFEKFYSEDVVMQENDEQTVVGKNANRDREKKIMDGMKGVREMKSVLKNVAVDKNVSFCEWVNEVIFKNGTHVTSSQVTRQVWNDEGQITHETFYHKGHGN